MTTIFDAHKNLAYSAVATAPSPATSGTSLVLSAGAGSLFPVAPFNVVCWPSGGATASQSNAEIVRVTAISTDTLTIIRAQEGSTAQSIGVGWQVALTATAKALTDIEAAVNATLGGSLSGTLPNPGIANGAVGTAQLAAGAVTQLAHATGVASGPTTTSSTPVNLPDMSVTLTTTGGDLLCWLVASLSNSAGNGALVSTALSLDGAAGVDSETTSSPGVGYATCMVSIAHFSGVSAASHTITGQWSTNGGTANAFATARYLLVVEVKK